MRGRRGNRIPGLCVGEIQRVLTLQTLNPEEVPGVVRSVRAGGAAVDADVAAVERVAAVFPGPSVRQNQRDARVANVDDFLLLFDVDFPGEGQRTNAEAANHQCHDGDDGRALPEHLPAVRPPVMRRLRRLLDEPVVHIANPV